MNNNKEVITLLEKILDILTKDELGKNKFPRGAGGKPEYKQTLAKQKLNQ